MLAATAPALGLQDVLVRLACAAPDPDAVMVLTCRLTMELAHGDSAVIELLDGEELLYAATAGTLEGSEGLRLKVGTSLSGLCLASGELQLCTDTETDSRVDRLACERLGIRSMIAVPLRRDGVPIGVLKVASSVPGTFGEDVRAALDAVGQVASARLDAALTASSLRRADAELANFQDQQHALFDALDSGVVSVRLDGETEYANKAAWELLCVTREQLYSADYPAGWELVHEDGSSWAPTDYPVARAIATGRVQRNLTMGLKLPSGEMRWLRVTAAPMRSALGLHGAVASFTDVTGRQQQLAALRASEERFRLTVDNSPIGTALVSPKGRYVQVNGALCLLLGYDQESLQRKSFQDITHPDDLQRLLDGVNRLRRGEQDILEIRKRYVHADGHEVWVDANVSVIRDEAGKALHYITQMQDASARRAAETALELQAKTDALTGLQNRRGWSDALADAARFVESGKSVAVAVLDLDHFKAFNDTRGHAAGDDLLRGCSEAWRRRLRSGDTLARLGGEEFGLLLPRSDIAGGHRVLDELRKLVPAGQTVSVGLTLLRPDEEPAAAVERADAALYEAKNGGRDRVVAK